MRRAFLLTLSALIPFSFLYGCDVGTGIIGDDDDDNDSSGDDDVSDDDATSDDDDTGDDDTASFSVDGGAVGPGMLFETYSGLLTTTGDAASPVTFAVSAGALPPGLDLGSDGLIAGAPADFGLWSFTVTATDAGGASASADLGIDVGYVAEEVYLSAVNADGEFNNMCTDDDDDSVSRDLCHPWVRIANAGNSGMDSRQLLPALFHIGPDGEAQDFTRGLGDDVLLHTLDPLEVTWSFTPIEGETSHPPETVTPEDATVSPEGLFQAGELTGPGEVGVADETWGNGTAPAHVITPDWCPEPHC